MKTIQAVLPLLLIGLAVACGRAPGFPESGLPVYGDPTLTPHWGREAERMAEHRIADFSLVDQLGQPATQDRLAGQLYVACFIFTTCGGICPRIVDNLGRVQDAFADAPDVQLVGHSVMPARDTPPVLRAYAEQHALRADKWLLLTGDPAVLAALARDSYFADETDDPRARADDLVHTEKVFLIDRERRIRGVYDGTAPHDVDRLIADLRTLLREPADSRS